VYNKITTGISIYPEGTRAPCLHNCDEHVALLEGSGEVEIAGQITPLQPPETTARASRVRRGRGGA
jgi:mannose-6-phosphate isomerase-like protein (cupin superfamily)